MNKKATDLLAESVHGAAASTEELLVLVYDQLRDIAERHLRRESADHSLQPTALVHEAFLRLIDQRKTDWQNTAHFRAIASNIMRRILVDHARAKATRKRGREFARVAVDVSLLAAGQNPRDIVALDEILTRLAALNARHAKIVEMRVFGGMSIQETATALGVSPATIKNDWRVARAWLLSELQPEDVADGGADHSNSFADS